MPSQRARPVTVVLRSRAPVTSSCHCPSRDTHALAGLRSTVYEPSRVNALPRGPTPLLCVVTTSLRLPPSSLRTAAAVRSIVARLTFRPGPVTAMSRPSLPSVNVAVTVPVTCTRPKRPVHSASVYVSVVPLAETLAQPAG